MSEPLARIHRSLDALGARERRLLAAQAGLQVTAALGGALLLLAGLYSAGVPRVEGAVAAGLVAVVGGGVAAAVPLAARWRAAVERVVQARRVEALRPALQGRLVTVVDRGARLVLDGLGEGAKPAPAGVSTVLLQRAADRAADVLEGVPPAEVLPPRGARRGVGLFALALALLLLGGWLLPVGPLDALAVAGGSSAAAARVASDAAEVAEEVATVGNITLRYVFPAYTGIDPVEVPNSDGTIHAPPGTSVQITARTRDVFDAAAIQVDDGPPVDITLTGGRDLAARLDVVGAGSWRFVLFEGNRIVYSPTYAIEVEADAAPVVAVEARSRPQVAVDQPVGLGWSVQDDYGVTKVVLEVTRADGTVEEHLLRQPLDPAVRLDGAVRKTPRALGLPPGETVKMRVVAYDNDLMGGTKKGESTEVEVTVQGARGRGRALTQTIERLRDELLDALADTVVEPVPPARSAEGMTAWVGTARERFVPIQEIAQEQWGLAERPDAMHAALVTTVLSDSARLFRFTLTTWEPGSGRRVTEGDLASFTRMHGEVVASTERAIFVLDQMLRQAAMGELARELQTIATESAELAAMTENLEAAEILARLDQLERLMSRMNRLAQKLDEGQMREFVNSRTAEAMNLMEAIRTAVSEGRMDDARAMLEELASRLQSMSETLNDNLAQQQQGEDELGEAFDQAMKDLSALKQDQETLADELAQVREQHGGAVAGVLEAQLLDLRRVVEVQVHVAEQVGLAEGQVGAVDEQLALWKELDSLAERAGGRSERVVEAVGFGEGWRRDTITRTEKLREGVAGIQDAVKGRDATRARDSVETANRPHRMTERLNPVELARARPASEPIPPGVSRARDDVQDIGQTLEKMLDLLEQLESRQAREPQAVQQAAREMASRQSELRERRQQLARDVRRVEQAMPGSDGEASRAMDQAGDAMERAEGALSDGQGMQSEGHQQEAARRLGEAQEQLDRQMKQHQQMQQSIQQMGGKGEGGGSGGQGEDGSEKGGDEGQGAPPSVVELPAPESFQTPEEYRRQLLEGMEGDVPDEFDALKRRYYEELVRQ